VYNITKGQLITDKTRVDGIIPVIAGGKSAAYHHNKANRVGKTITVSGSGANAGYVSFHSHPIFASDCSTIEESKSYSIEFIYFFLKLKQNDIYNAQTGGAQPHIHPSDLNPMVIDLPDKNEQKAIAQILSDMDAEITQLETKKEKYQAIKQGMMQELLTGKTRLV
jgi:type I restriction enzyme S subunit